MINGTLANSQKRCSSRILVASTSKIGVRSSGCSARGFGNVTRIGTGVRQEQGRWRSALQRGVNTAATASLPDSFGGGDGRPAEPLRHRQALMIAGKVDNVVTALGAERNVVGELPGEDSGAVLRLDDRAVMFDRARPAGDDLPLSPLGIDLEVVETRETLLRHESIE